MGIKKYMLNFPGVSTIRQTFSNIRNSMNESVAEGSELNARVRYSVAEKIMEEFEAERKQMELNKLGKKHTVQDRPSFHYAVKSADVSKKSVNPWLTVSTQTEDQTPIRSLQQE